MMKKLIALAMCSMLAVGALGTVAMADETEGAAAPAPGEAAGFTEITIANEDGSEVFDGIEVGNLLSVSAVYFQPVPMSDSVNQDISAEDYDIHLECDVSALENNLGYGVGDWVPYLTIDYSVVNADTEEVAAEGTFMEMAASDGPHYGNNIKLPDAGTYNVTFTIHSPGENGYLIHTDSETGPGGTLADYFGDGNLEVTFEGWAYTPQEW